MEIEKRKCISVTFVKDEDVIQHILHVEDKKAGKKLTASKRKLIYSEGACKSARKRILGSGSGFMNIEDGCSDEEDILKHVSALNLQDGNLPGQEVFSFRTPKRAGQMVQKALNTSHTTTPKTLRNKKGSRNGEVFQKQVPVADEETSQQNQNSTSLRQAPQSTTPYRLRKRNADDQSSDDSIDETTSDADSEEDVAKVGKGRQTIEATRNVEEYFDLHAAPGVTSDRTMSRLELPQMDIEVLRDILQKTVTSHSKLQKSLCDKHHKLFRSWMYNMCNGFNLLLYGLGSKRELLEMFEKEYLSNFSHLVVNGYFPSLTIKQILNSITEDIFHHKGSFRSPLDQLDFIKSLFETKTHQDFFILCNSIDGAMLRGEKTQNILSLLAQIRGIHFIASVDHINAPLVWDQTKCSRFNWLWYDVTTFNRYIAETSYENSLLVQQSGGLALKSLAHVMRSLTPNARKIFQLLAHYQLENSDNSSFIGMSFQDLYIRCRELFLVNSDQTLRAQLVEFRDHKLIRSRKNYDGGEYLLVPIEIQALKEFLEQDDFN